MNFLNYLNIIAVNTTLIVIFISGFLLVKIINFSLRFYKTLRLFFKLRKGKKVHDGPTVPRDN